MLRKIMISSSAAIMVLSGCAYVDDHSSAQIPTKYQKADGSWVGDSILSESDYMAPDDGSIENEDILDSLQLRRGNQPLSLLFQTTGTPEFYLNEELVEGDNISDHSLPPTKDNARWMKVDIPTDRCVDSIKYRGRSENIFNRMFNWYKNAGPREIAVEDGVYAVFPNVFSEYGLTAQPLPWWDAGKVGVNIWEEREYTEIDLLNFSHSIGSENQIMILGRRSGYDPRLYLQAFDPATNSWVDVGNHGDDGDTGSTPQFTAAIKCGEKLKVRAVYDKDAVSEARVALLAEAREISSDPTSDPTRVPYPALPVAWYTVTVFSPDADSGSQSAYTTLKLRVISLRD